MADAYIGEIRLLPYNYAPDGWFACNGQQLPIAQYNALYAVIGGLYGTATATAFYLPDLRSRTAMGSAASNNAGSVQGANSITLDATQVSAHNHALLCNLYPSSSNPPASNMRLGVDSSQTFASYKVAPNTQQTVMNANIVAPVGQNQPHENRQPYLAIQFCICYDGIWPAKP